jgi:translation initiation factor 1
MAEVCKRCGLPLPLCVCKVIEREEAKIRIFVEKRRWGKCATIVEGITGERKKIASRLKSWLACGGTIKEDRIELQGDHRLRLKELLVKLGFERDQIEVI